MADTIKKADNATKKKRGTVKLPKARGHNAIQEEFFAINGRTYYLKRGEYVEVPEEVEEVIKNGENAEEAAFDYVESINSKTNDEALK